MTPIDRLKTLLSVDGLAVAGALVKGPADSATLSGLVGLDRQDVLRALGPLVNAGLVTTTDQEYALDRAMLRSISQDLAEPALPMDPSIGFGMTDEERAVLANYFEARVLTDLPASRAKRLIVLERLALEFDVGRKYPKEEVNSILGAFHPDWSALRRALVDEGMLDREQNVYWRSGGRVPGVYRG